MIFSSLREATAATHARVENLLPLMHPQLTRQQYTHTLQTFFSLYTPFEKEVERATRHSAFAPEVLSRQKVNWLLQDLLALGLNTWQIARIVPAATPALPSIPHALGAMYVMEGATLGGQHITKRLARDFPQIPCRFFTSYGADTGARWKQFRTLIESVPSADHDAVIHGALTTFTCFEETFGAARAVKVESES